MENENTMNDDDELVNIQNENTMNDDELVNHPLFRLIMQSVQMIPQQNDDILQTTFDEQKVENKPTCNTFVESLNELYVTDVDVENGLSCSICQDEFVLNDKVLELPCEPQRHYFHIKNDQCDGVLPWLSLNNTCPMCRYEFPTPEVEEPKLPESLRPTNTELSEEQISGLNTPIPNMSDDPDDIAEGIATNAANATNATNVANATNASNIDNTNIVAPDFETVLMNLINSRNQNNQNINMIPSIMLPNMQMDTVRDGFSDNDIDEALRRSLID